MQIPSSGTLIRTIALPTIRHPDLCSLEAPGRGAICCNSRLFSQSPSKGLHEHRRDRPIEPHPPHLPHRQRRSVWPVHSLGRAGRSDARARDRNHDVTRQSQRHRAACRLLRHLPGAGDGCGLAQKRAPCRFDQHRTGLAEYRNGEGGTWAEGRSLATALRGGEPPIRMVSDGTVF